MELWLWGIIGILVIAIIILIIKLYLIKKATQEIIDSFENSISSDTNIVIDISSHDKHMRHLAASINTQLRQLRRQKHRYQKGDNELKDAITNIAHDLRTPLTAICGYLDLINLEEKSDTISRYISMISNRTEALKNLTEELFKYSVLVSINDITTENICLNTVLEESIISFYEMMEQHGIHPSISITETKIERTLNSAALSRIFENIISNVIKYSEGDFEVVMDENGRIVFSNTASKLSTVDVEKLFNRFFTVESGRDSTGLGLSIAKLLTERMGGMIKAEYENHKLIISIIFNNIIQ